MLLLFENILKCKLIVYLALEAFIRVIFTETTWWQSVHVENESFEKEIQTFYVSLKDIAFSFSKCLKTKCLSFILKKEFHCASTSCWHSVERVRYSPLWWWLCCALVNYTRESIYQYIFYLFMKLIFLWLYQELSQLLILFLCAFNIMHYSIWLLPGLTFTTITFI